MLFNSYSFIFVFIPLVFLGFFIIGRHSHALASLWLAAASLFFYGWWDVRYVSLLLSSVVFNFGAGYLVGHSIMHRPVSQSRLLLAGGIAVNLVLLGYFKYANFFITNLDELTGISLTVGQIILPLGISFFTFTQIAFLVDTYQGKVKEFNFVHYLLFVTYFPHLIAGPVLHHKEMMPQFAKRSVCNINWNNVAIGVTIFVLGLAQKTILADSMSVFATPIFDAVKSGRHIMFFEAWAGALGYTLQLYFDFSGYSSMAIGLSLMFNVCLPINFNSPYKATSIIDFWRRWHMTLSRFLRDYLYIPLGGSRNGKTRRYVNLMITMLLGGLWHGAAWTYVIWGGLHGIYLLVNHAYRIFKQHFNVHDGGRWARLGAGALTFLAVTVGWVFFRSDSVASAMIMLQTMAGMNGVTLMPLFEPFLEWVPPNWDVVFDGMMPISANFIAAKTVGMLLAIGLAIAWLFPNIQQMFLQHYIVYKEGQYEVKDSVSLPGAEADRFEWRLTRAHAWITGLVFALAVMGITKNSEFLYYQF